MAERRDDGFLARWSRRKHAARAAEREHEAQQDEATPAPTRAAAADPKRKDPAADTPALPDPATLDLSSDFSAFLGKDVPVDTQRAALRRLWRLDPIYNRLDGLDDYCADFTDRATVVQGLRTAYRVGRGLLERAGEAAADPHAPQSHPPGNEAQRLAAGSDEPTPPEDPEPGMPPAAEVAPPRSEPGRSEPRRSRPLPKRS